VPPAHRDPQTGETSYVFSCFNQTKQLRSGRLQRAQRASQTELAAEKLTAKWIRYCMPELKKQRSFV